MFLPAARIFVDWWRRRNHAPAGAWEPGYRVLDGAETTLLDMLAFKLSLDLALLERRSRNERRVLPYTSGWIIYVMNWPSGALRLLPHALQQKLWRLSIPGRRLLSATEPAGGSLDCL